MRLHRELTDLQLRWFGVSLAAVLGIFAGFAYWQWEARLTAGLLAATAAMLLWIYYALPASRRPIYRAVQTATLPVHWLALTLLLSIVYYAVLTPIGLVLRLRGRDPLDRTSPGAGETKPATYWKKRPPPPPPERYFKTF